MNLFIDTVLAVPPTVLITLFTGLRLAIILLRQICPSFVGLVIKEPGSVKKNCTMKGSGQFTVPFCYLKSYHAGLVLLFYQFSIMAIQILSRITLNFCGSCKHKLFHMVCGSSRFLKK